MSRQKQSETEKKTEKTILGDDEKLKKTPEISETGNKLVSEPSSREPDPVKNTPKPKRKKQKKSPVAPVKVAPPVLSRPYVSKPTVNGGQNRSTIAKKANNGKIGLAVNNNNKQYNVI